MKKILITGANSYIGTSFETYMKQYDNYCIDTLDMLDPKWKEYDFSSYDTVFHVAGIAHSDVGKISKEKKALYYKINTQLSLETALKAKKSGVKQFIYMSSIIVYGEGAPLGKKKVITKDTEPNPVNFYGDSKLQADIRLMKLRSELFKICILRPPMIYGPNSKGNYQMLSKIAKKIPIFPNIRNERSMLYIENLSIFIKKCIDNMSDGIFFPQNAEYICTSNMVKLIAQANNRYIYLTKILNPCVYLMAKMPGKIGRMCNKAFGSIVYEKECLLDEYGFNMSIEKTEKNDK